ncbi:MAG TPA: RusA family crossover junction endodeoxyribonuclease [Longimicrobium sp.]|nr:RusA family crossover junction endodeoxyribonuclease [Longimicrobium sp.]
MRSADMPPDGGILNIKVPVAPVSSQAPAAKKSGIIAAVRGAVAHYRYLLGDDVKIEIQWHISARTRYESDSSADVDNIVKPVLDALCGPEGVLIDDCQVQELVCYWSGGYSKPEHQQVEIELEFDPEAWVAKDGLFFLQVDRALYLPMHGDIPMSIVMEQAEHLVRRFESAREMLSKGVPPSSVYLTLSVQRVYHRSKIGAFQRMTLDDLRARLG